MRKNEKLSIKEGETYTVVIEKLGQKGDGLARVNGAMVVIPSVEVREKVKIQVTKVLPKISFAKVIERINNPNRRPQDEVVEYDDNLDSEDF